eukprot:jgi/Chlat1/8434/Chrsp80S07921
MPQPLCAFQASSSSWSAVAACSRRLRCSFAAAVAARRRASASSRQKRLFSVFGFRPKRQQQLQQRVACVGVQASIATSGRIEETSTSSSMAAPRTAVVADKIHFGLKTQLRVAGGWVRDKLLGRESHDIDIALDDMLGREFGEKVNEYLTLKGMKTHRLGVVLSNPEQSKHLETAVIRVNEEWIDLVNLRSETYAQDSRIPQMDFGTPEQDALRRDLTINSLFYNISTGAVEDLTGKGVDDLRRGIIRTPLPPQETFLDDPLRVLRALRFGARFAFTLDADLMEAAASSKVHAALSQKISRERIGVEVDSMLKGPINDALTNVHRLGLWSIIFALPSDVDTRVVKGFERCGKFVFAELEALLQAAQHPIPSEDVRLCRYAALLLPLLASTVGTAKKKPVAASTHIIRESLKLKAKDAENVVALHTAAVHFAQLLPRLRSTAENGSTDAPAVDNIRVEAGLLLRQTKELWRGALLLSLLLDSPAARALGAEGEEADENVKQETSRDAVRADVYRNVEAAVVGLGLEGVWNIKPLLDGKAVMQLLKLQGQKLGQVMDQQLRWQLAHPSGTADDCRTWLVGEFKEGGQ